MNPSSPVASFSSLAASSSAPSDVTPAPSPEAIEQLRSSIRTSSLYRLLAEVPDRRGAQGRRYPLPVLLTSVLLGLCCGCGGYLSCARWLRALPAETLSELGFSNGRTPCAATFLNVFRVLDWDEVSKQLWKWTSTLGESDRAPSGKDSLQDARRWLGLAIDGKWLRGSLAEKAETACIVSMVSHETGHNVIEAGVPRKRGELSLAPDLVETAVGPGTVVTGDALFTQRALCETIVEKQGHYLLIVKGNQKTLKEQVQGVLGQVTSKEAAEQKRHVASQGNVGHGRAENRIIVLATPRPGEVDWPGAKQVFALTRSRSPHGHGRKPIKESWEVVYGITSLGAEEATAAETLDLQRMHWSIENRVHWVLDTFFREDEKRILIGKVARALATLRRAALTILKGLGKRSVPHGSDVARADPSAALRAIAKLGVVADN